MKKLILVPLVGIMLLCGCKAMEIAAQPNATATSAQEQSAAPQSAAPQSGENDKWEMLEVKQSGEYDVDLDCDGTPEKLSVNIANSDNWEGIVKFTVNGSEEMTFDGSRVVAVRVVDVNESDKQREILVEVDDASDDFEVRFFRYVNNKLEKATVAAIDNMGKSEQRDSVYGSFLKIENGALYFDVVQNILGSWGSVVRFDMAPDSFTFTQSEDEIAPSVEVTVQITVKNALPVETLSEDGSYAAATLKAGEKLTLTGTDGHCKYAYYKTQNGEKGRISINRQEDGMLYINGKVDQEYFEILPYVG